MSQTVWVVGYSVPYEGDNIYCIFSSQELADEYAKGFKDRLFIDEYQLDKDKWECTPTAL